MSYFNEKFNTPVYLYRMGTKYKRDTVVVYLKKLYIALKDTDAKPSVEKTDENWEYIDPDSTINIITNLGASMSGNPISIGLPDYPFNSGYFMERLNFVYKNKTGILGHKGCITFGRCAEDEGTTVDLGVMYDEDGQNPYLIASDQFHKGIDFGNGVNRIKAIYSTTSESSISDKNYIKEYSDLDPKYLDLLSKISPIEYVLKDNDSERTHIGFLADDVEKAMKDLNISSKEFAGLVKHPIYKKDIYRDFNINKSCILAHYELDEEVYDDEYSYKNHLTGKDLVRYVSLPSYSKKLGWLLFKNYPLSDYPTNNKEDMTIIIKSIKLIPFDETKEPYEIDLSKVNIVSEYREKIMAGSYHEVLDDGSLKITFDKDAYYNHTRISLSENEMEFDASEYKYVRIVSDYEQAYLVGFSDYQSMIDYDNGVSAIANEEGQMYSNALNNRYEVATYVYSLRYDEFIAINTAKIKELSHRVETLEQTVDELKSLINELNSK